ncbi:MAG: transglutaminase domain protein [Frankiales bacterium]|nr:transglutaminase domain protein [Frankiales bacterium]
MNRRAHIAVLGAIATALSASTLSALFADPGWIPHVIGVIAAVTLGGELGAHAGRRLGASTMLRALGGLLGALFFTSAVFAHPVSWLGFVPNRASFGYLRNDWLAGSADMHDLSPKVPSHLGLTLFVVVGVAAIAFVVNMLVSRPAIAGLPLLTMFVIPVALAPNGVGLLPFVLAASGYLVLLAAEGRDRAERWGRSLPRRRDTVANGYGQSGRRIGTAAVALAVFLPLVVPGLHANRLISNGDPGFGDGPGGGASTALSPLAKIKGRLTTQARSEYFTYTTSDGKPQYTRIVVDDVFDGTQFLNSGMDTPARAKNLNVTPHGLVDAVAREPIDVTISMKALREQYLPVPLPLATLSSIPDSWRYDDKTDTIFAAHADTGGLSYTARSLSLKPTAEQLRAAGPVDVSDPYFDRYLKLPAGLDNELRVLYSEAQRVTAGASSEYDKAKLLEKWFSSTGGFVYDEQGPTGLEENALTEFIRNKRGYCVQFASSMAIMARLLNIPSRVDVGFTGGSELRSSPGTFVVASTDSHAWPELYFGGVGWVRFEPTPANGTVGLADLAQIPEPAPHPTVGAPTPFRDIPTTSVAPVSVIPWALVLKVLAGLAAFTLFGLPALLTRYRRRRAWANAADDAVARAHVAWREVLVTAENLGYRFEPGLSIRGIMAAIEESTPLSRLVRHALETVARAEEIANYAKVPPPADPEIGSSSRIVRDALFAAASRRRRLRAIVLPPETMRTWRRSVGAFVGRLFELFDTLVTRVTSLGRRTTPAPR